MLGVHAAALALGLSLGGQIELNLPPATGPVLQVRLLPVPVAAPVQIVSASPTVATAPRIAQAPTSATPKRPAPPLALALAPPEVPAPAPAVAQAAAPPAAAPLRAVEQASGVPMGVRPPPTIASVATAAPASAPLRLTRGPVALPGNVMPAYPQAAREDGLEGPVDLWVGVTAQGLVRQVDWARRSGILLLDLAARNAVRQWRFQPALQDGEPVAGSLHVVIRFRLDAPVTLVALGDTGSR